MDASLLWACGERPSNPAANSAEALANQPTGLAPATRSATAAAAEQASKPISAQTVPSAMLGATGGSAARLAGRVPVDAGSSSRAQASGSPAAAPPNDRMRATSPRPALPAQNIAETSPPERRTADPAETARASNVTTNLADTAASLFARLVARSDGRISELDGEALEPGDAAVAAGDADRIGGEGFAEEGSLAFQALLVPVPASNPQPASQSPQEAGDASAGDKPSVGSSIGLSGGRSGAPASRDPDFGLAVAVQTGQAGGTAQTLLPAAPVSSSADAGAASHGTSQSHGAASSPESHSAASAAEPAAEPQTTASGAAREIRLELRDAEARVNVRLVERAGTVQVDVRTPDSHLAGSLRDDLPALTARLEQTGLRAETWHDAPAATSGRIRLAESVSSASSQLSQDQSRRDGGGRDPRDGQPPEKRQNHPQPESKEFSWLYTSLT